ncbi:MAG: hypothetical protein ACTS4Z_01375 [Candidatus Hodgkinia cicadicola]
MLWDWLDLCLEFKRNERRELWKNMLIKRNVEELFNFGGSCYFVWKETRTEVWFAIWLNNKIKLSCNGANLALALEELANGDC